MGQVASTLTRTAVACATAAGAVALGIVSAPIAVAGAAVATLAAPLARGVNYIRRNRDPTYADNLEQYNSKFARHTQNIINLWERIYRSPSRNLLDGLNNILVYKPIVQDIQPKLNQFNMNYYITLLNKSEKMQLLFESLYSENKTKIYHNFELYDGNIIKYNNLEHSKSIFSKKSFVALWINGKGSSNNPLRKSIYDKFMEINSENIDKMIKRLDKFTDELSDDIIWTDTISIDEFRQKINLYSDVSINNLLNAITMHVLAHRRKLEAEIDYYRGKNRSWSETFKAWTQGMVDTLYRSGFSASETADAYEKHIDIVIRGILDGAGYGTMSLIKDYKNAGNKINDIVENLKILKKHINQNNNKITIQKDGSIYKFTIEPTSITTLSNFAMKIDAKLNEIGLRCAYNKATGRFQFWSTQYFKIIGRETTIFDWIGLEPNDYESVQHQGNNNEYINAVVSQNLFPTYSTELDKYINSKKLHQEQHILNNIRENYKLFLVNMKRVTYLERMKIKSDAENN